MPAGRFRLPTNDELYARESMMGHLLPWFLSGGQTTRFSRELEEAKRKSPEEKVHSFITRFGSAFSPDARNVAETAAHGGRVNEDNYWSQVIRNYISGGGVEKPKMAKNVATGPGIHSDWNAVAEAADLASRRPYSRGLLEQAAAEAAQPGGANAGHVGRAMDEMQRLYEERYGRPFVGRGFYESEENPGVGRRHTGLLGFSAWNRNWRNRRGY